MTEEVTTLSRALGEESDHLGEHLGEQFMRWFLSEQVDEVAQMTTMLNITDRWQGNVFDLEDYLKRDPAGDSRYEPTAPRTAGGKL